LERGRIAGTRIVASAPEHAAELEELQRVCFPGLAVAERMKAAHFLEHQRRFPEGEFVAVSDLAPDGSRLAAERVVGLGSGFLIDFDLSAPDHSFLDFIAGGTYAKHDPNGEWYYGADISVHPDYRGHGIGRRLYEARKALVTRLNRRGIVAGGALPGYRHHSGELNVEEYVARIVAGELHDPTLDFQLSNGFEVMGLVRDYMTDEHTGNAASLIVWRNPEYREPTPSSATAGG
ncbi:MAG TPA: GNAT family N-acetyltransferase, partial [Trueperaceae bacterium]|nr:GNAT family N-acetyltransferase [Trueperaceae bacterium]